MNIRNYTSSVPVDQSLLAIERLLLQVGATHITKQYDEQGGVIGLSFLMQIKEIPLSERQSNHRTIADDNLTHRAMVVQEIISNRTPLPESPK